MGGEGRVLGGIRLPRNLIMGVRARRRRVGCMVGVGMEVWRRGGRRVMVERVRRGRLPRLESGLRCGIFECE